jgi:hypothetical protein
MHQKKIVKKILAIVVGYHTKTMRKRGDISKNEMHVRVNEDFIFSKMPRYLRRTDST